MIVKPPADFVKSLKATAQGWNRWRELSSSHQREHVEAIIEAKKPETRARRVAAAVKMVAANGRKRTA